MKKDELAIVPESHLPLEQQAEIMKHRLAMAQKFFLAKCFTSDVQNAEQAFVKLQAGAEMGMQPMEAMQSLYIVNGRVSLWGTALAKRLRDQGWGISYEDDEAKSTCKVTITKDKETFSEKVDGKTDKVIQGSRAFKFAPKDKLRWHCLGRLVRFNVPEVLGGQITYLKEEVEDFKPEPIKKMVIEADEPERPSIEKEKPLCADDHPSTNGVTEEDFEEALEKAKELTKTDKRQSAIPY